MRIQRTLGPWRKVVESELLSGGVSFFLPNVPLGNVWMLKLECGHTVQRRAKYAPDPNINKLHKHDWWRRRRPTDALPPPKRVRCGICDMEQTLNKGL